MSRTMKLMLVVLFLTMAVILTPILSSAAQVKNPDTLIWGVYWELKTLDPHTISDWASKWQVDNIYEGLVKYGTEEINGDVVGTAKIVPSLAKSWDISEDGLTYTFHLQEDVKFHDNTPFNAEAVKYSINRMLAIDFYPASAISRYIDTNSTEVIDDHTVQVTLKQPSLIFVGLLAGANTGAIVSPTYVEEHGGVRAGELNEWMNTHECGTGPFMMGEWRRGEYWELVANPDYWRGAPKLKKVCFKIIMEASTRRLMLEQGDIDIVYRLPAMYMEAMEQNPDIVICSERGCGLQAFYLNNQTKPFDDVRVRKAVLYAIDQEAIAEAAVFGLAPVARSPLPAAVGEGFTDEFWVYERNIEKAKALLADAGYPDGFTTEVYYNSGDVEKEQCIVMIQSQLREIGIKLEIRAIAWPTYMQNIYEGKMPSFVISNTFPPVVEEILTPAYHSENWGAKGNWNFYADEQVDRLLDRLLEVTVPEERLDIIRDLQLALLANPPAAFLYEAIRFNAARSWFKGWVLYPSGDWYFYPAYKG